jgi:hypothetical protein
MLNMEGIEEDEESINSNDELENCSVEFLEAKLMADINERIARAEEEHSMISLDKKISAAIEAFIMKEDNGSDLEEWEYVKVRRKERMTKYPDPDDIPIETYDCVERLKYIRASKLIPRFFGKVPRSKKDLVEFFVAKLKHHYNFLPMDWKGFRLQFRSASPNSWLLIVSGYKKPVQCLMHRLQVMFSGRKQIKQEHV